MNENNTTNSSDKILAGLNDKQLQAVQNLENVSLIIAGAGSGKTAVLTRRAALLVLNKTQPGEILCLTFTNKAAKEMNIRVEKLLTENNYFLPAIKPWENDYNLRPLLSTYHSLGVRIIREFGESLNINKNFSILDSDDQKKVVKGIFKELNIDVKTLQPSLALYFISKCKQELLDSANSHKLNQEFLPIFHDIYKKYEARLSDSQSLDFDDLILKTFFLLRDFPEVRAVLQKRWKHIMVDEFQDTNPAQFEIVQLLQPPQLSQETGYSLFVVGDDAQSIYGFRGSKVEIILDFHKIYPKTIEIILNQNYRSTQPILDLAEKVLSHNPKQKKKDLFTQNTEDLSVKYYLARNDQDEAQYIIRQLQNQYLNTQKPPNDEQEMTLEVENFFEDEVNIIKPKAQTTNPDPVSSMFDVYLENDDFKPTTFTSYTPQSWVLPETDWSKIEKLNDCVVLYRTHSQSRSIEEVFLKNKLPYKLVSGTRFLDRKEIKDILAILKFIANPEDLISASRFLPLIMDGVGPKTLSLILNYLQGEDVELSGKHQLRLNQVFEALHLHTDSNSLISFTKDIITNSGYHRYLKTEYPLKEELESRLENIGELYSLMFPFDQDPATSIIERLSIFLNNISLMSQQDQDLTGDIPKISLMSLHQSKGLEFETVFLIGVEDGLLPHQNSFYELKGFEEEVRLAYVAVTRAKKYLHLISADSRVQFGQIKANPVSRIFRPFLDTFIKRQQ